MLVTIQAIRSGRVAEAASGNDLLFVFPLPVGANVRLGHVLHLDPFVRDRPQLVEGPGVEAFSIVLRSHDIHDLRMSMRHGGSRTPTGERVRGT